jgi:hypothetical protein
MSISPSNPSIKKEYHQKNKIPSERWSLPLDPSPLLCLLSKNRTEASLLHEMASTKEKIVEGPLGDVVGQIETLRRENLKMKEALQQKEDQ